MRLSVVGLIATFTLGIFLAPRAAPEGEWGADRAAPPDRRVANWPAYGRDSGGTRYSPLAQITRANVTQLKVAWTYRTGEADRKAVSGGRASFEATPLVVDGILYLSTPFNRVIALDPETGAERWT